MSQYGKTQYWEERYIRDPQPFDWYQRYFSIRELIGQYVPIENKILNVGAGNSRLSEEMFDDGYQNITNIDFSSTSIKTMSQKLKQKGANFKYLLMDVRAMQFPQNSFDTVIDKGTFDSVVCGEGSSANVNKMISQIYRVLSANGTYIMISFGNRATRLHHLKKPEYDWGVWVHQLPKPTITATITQANKQHPERNSHYMYVCIKGKRNEQQNPVSVEGQVATQQK